MDIKELLRLASLIAERDRVSISDSFRRGELFNVFRMCHVDHYENMHSSILAEWLNPKGSHGQGDLFLRLFLESIDAVRSKDFQTVTAKVSTEVSTEYGRLDLLLEDQSGQAIIIENKIYAADQASQLKRYAEYALSRYGRGGYTLLYLTLYGDEASEQSRQGVAYSLISYQETILGWVERCIKEVCNKPLLRESLIQYKNLIKQLTGQDMDKKNREELVAEMLRNPDGTAEIVKAYPEWENTILKNLLFVPLQKFAEEKDLEFDVSDRFWSKRIYGEFWFAVQPKLKIVFEYGKQGRYTFYCGIIDERKDKRERKNLPGLQGGNDTWRYGWRYLDGIYRDWTVDTIAKIANDNSELLSYIKDTVESLLKEMQDNNIL